MFKHYKDKVFIDGEEIPLRYFLILEPAYSYPKDLIVMFYDGKRRNYRTEHGSWSIMGRWSEGERYVARKADFVRFVAEDRAEDLYAMQRVMDTRTESVSAPVETPEAKYATEVRTDVELHERVDLVEGGTEGVRAPRKRTSRRRDKHSG